MELAEPSLAFGWLAGGCGGYQGVVRLRSCELAPRGVVAGDLGALEPRDKVVRFSRSQGLRALLVSFCFLGSLKPTAPEPAVLRSGNMFSYPRHRMEGGLRSFPMVKMTDGSYRRPLPPVIGHRGAKQIAPENTLASIRAAKERGVTVVEVDVMLTKDGVPVIHHDNTLDRCTDGKGMLWDKTLAELKNLDAGSWFGEQYKNERLPMLSEFLAECKRLGLGLNLEIKHATDKADDAPNEFERDMEISLATAVCDVFEELHVSPHDVIFSSFSVHALRVVHKRLPQFQRSLLVEAIPANWEKQMRQVGASSLNFNHKKCAKEQVESISKRVPTYCYTVNSVDRAFELMSWGVSGVFSDCPYDIMHNLCEVASPRPSTISSGTEMLPQPASLPALSVQAVTV
mmetsp:Transcript_2885/g.4685  ORF Transcript_2885/g.4685 Transcript_2885/m.4685 type:complete len:400 (-) Transcript_2885:100-1299(-)